MQTPERQEVDSSLSLGEDGPADTPTLISAFYKLLTKVCCLKPQFATMALGLRKAWTSLIFHVCAYLETTYLETTDWLQVSSLVTAQAGLELTINPV